MRTSVGEHFDIFVMYCFQCAKNVYFSLRCSHFDEIAGNIVGLVVSFFFSVFMRLTGFSLLIFASKKWVNPEKCRRSVLFKKIQMIHRKNGSLAKCCQIWQLKVKGSRTEIWDWSRNWYAFHFSCQLH